MKGCRDGSSVELKCKQRRVGAVLMVQLPRRRKCTRGLPRLASTLQTLRRLSCPAHRQGELISAPIVERWQKRRKNSCSSHERAMISNLLILNAERDVMEASALGYVRNGCTRVANEIRIGEDREIDTARHLTSFLEELNYRYRWERPFGGPSQRTTR